MQWGCWAERFPHGEDIMQAAKRHEVKALMSTVHKEAENEAVSLLTREVKRLMRGRAGASAESRAANVKSALSLVESVANLLLAEGTTIPAVFEAEALLNEAVEAGEPESKYATHYPSVKTALVESVEGAESPFLAEAGVEA